MAPAANAPTLLDLRPPLLDDLGLVPALRWYLDREAQRAGLRVEFFANPALERVDAAIETACFRVAQEALTNVMRHARAQTVSVEVDRALEVLYLVVRDDGIGFDVVTAQQSARFGTLGMRERVALLGVSWTASPRPAAAQKCMPFFRCDPDRTHRSQVPGYYWPIVDGAAGHPRCGRPVRSAMRVGLVLSEWHPRPSG